jgi:hypothetical protein
VSHSTHHHHHGSQQEAGHSHSNSTNSTGLHARERSWRVSRDPPRHHGQPGTLEHTTTTKDALFPRHHGRPKRTSGFFTPTPRLAPMRPAYFWGRRPPPDAKASSHRRSAAVTQSRSTPRILPLRSGAPPSTGRNATTCRQERLAYLNYYAGIAGGRALDRAGALGRYLENCRDEREGQGEITVSGPSQLCVHFGMLFVQILNFSLR